jgi:hypothetical protein
MTTAEKVIIGVALLLALGITVGMAFLLWNEGRRRQQCEQLDGVYIRETGCFARSSVIPL